MKLVHSNSSDPDFQELCSQLDAELNQRYGMAQTSYDKHNIIKDKQPVLVGYIDDIPVACGCFRPYDAESVEIKRMYVKEPFRRRGISTKILKSLEQSARDSGFITLFLETGKGQPEAINLYQKEGFKRVDNYGPYTNMGNSLCMKKR